MTELLYDLQPLNAMVDGNEKFRKYLIELFIQTTPPILEDLNSSLAAKDYDGIYAHTHKVKPTLDSMGMVSLRKTVENLLQGSKHKKSLEELEPLVKKLCSHVNKAIEHLQLNEL